MRHILCGICAALHLRARPCQTRARGPCMVFCAMHQTHGKRLRKPAGLCNLRVPSIVWKDDRLAPPAADFTRIDRLTLAVAFATTYCRPSLSFLYCCSEKFVELDKR